jgi:hypothetical protein
MNPSKRLITGPVQGCAYFLLCLGMIAIGVFLFRTMFWTPVSAWRAAQSWQELPCTVVESRVIRNNPSGKAGLSYRPGITYEYELYGRTYRSSRYSFRDDYESADSGDSSEIVDRYPPGLRTTCWVDPAHPSEAVLDREFGGVLLFGLMMGLFAPAGAFAFFVGLKQLFRGGNRSIGKGRRRR